MADVIDFPKARIVRIPPAHQVDVRLEFARQVEQQLADIEKWSALMGEGKLPARFAEECLPSDSEAK